MNWSQLPYNNNLKIFHQKLVKDQGFFMLNRPILEPISQGRRKLSINTSNSNFSKPIRKFSETIKIDTRTSIDKPQGQRLLQDIDSREVSKEDQGYSLRLENLSFKKFISQNNSEQKSQDHRILRSSLKNIRTQNSYANFPSIEIKNEKEEQQRVQVQNKRATSNKSLVLSLLMSTSSNRRSQSKAKNEEEFLQSTEPKKLLYLRRSQTVTQKPKEEVLEQLNTIDSQSINQASKFQSSSLESQKSKKLLFDFLNISVAISPTVKIQKADVQVQAIQQQREFYQYLKYKRRKVQFQNQLQNLFTQISLAKNSRVVCQNRILKLKEFQKKLPENQREQRVFNIRKEISDQQAKIRQLVFEKVSVVERYLTQIDKLNRILLKDSEKFLETFKGTFKVNPEENDHDFSKKTLAKMELCIKNFLKQSIKKIQVITQHNRPPKDGFLQLLSAFNEYKSTILQQKALLKIFFDQIKKVPQLCYGLCGNKLPNMDVKNQFRDENNEFLMPKCMDCFKSQWKLHVIVEKNISMESIFKVTEQLLV